MKFSSANIYAAFDLILIEKTNIMLEQIWKLPVVLNPHGLYLCEKFIINRLPS